MIGRRLLPVMFFGLVFALVADSGNADARQRCRQGRASQGWTTSTYNTGYAYTTSSTNTGWAAPNTVSTNPTVINGGTVSGVAAPAYPTANQLNNGTQVHTTLRPAQPAQPAVINRSSNVAPDPSPDADNSLEHRTTTSIPGANPAKAPAPPAAATP